MNQAATIEASPREGANTGAARAVRRAGRIPGIVYGGGKDPMPISVDDRIIRREMHRPGFFSTPMELKIGGETEQVLPREVQVHPVTEAPLHVDFMRVSPATRIRIAIPVVFENEAASPGLKRGGVLNVVRREIEVVCAVSAIPKSIAVDLTGLDIGDSVHVSRITLPPGVRPTIARDFTIAAIAAPTVVAVEEAKPAVPIAEEAPAEVPAIAQKAEQAARAGKEGKE